MCKEFQDLLSVFRTFFRKTLATGFSLTYKLQPCSPRNGFPGMAGVDL